MLLVLGLQHVAFAVGEDLEGSGQAAVTPLLGHHLHALHFAQLDSAVVKLILLLGREGEHNKEENISGTITTLRISKRTTDRPFQLGTDCQLLGE